MHVASDDETFQAPTPGPLPRRGVLHSSRPASLTSAAALGERGVILHRNGSGALALLRQTLPGQRLRTLGTHESVQSKSTLRSIFSRRPSAPVRGWMSKTWRNDAMKMKSASVAKWRPGQTLPRSPRPRSG